MKAVLASKNKHKLQEIQEILSQYDFDLVLQSELGVDVDPDENGTTFEENSYIKAKAVLEATGMITIADDSGLWVDALGGAPGVHSARYGGADYKTDRDRLKLLLQNMEGISDRTARFVCVITLLYPDGKKLVARGECEGVIDTAPRGNSDFGYDPVFYVPSEGCTFSEMGNERKNAISHRSNALKNLCKMLEKEL